MITVLIVLGLVAAMIGVNALYVAGEFAAVSARKSRISQAANDGNRFARMLLPVLEDPHRLDNYIAASQVGITLSSIVLGIYGQRQIAPMIEPIIAVLPFFDDPTVIAGASALLVLIFLTVLQVVLGELVPKSVALLYPEQLALATVVPMRWSGDILLKPFIFILNGSGIFLLKLLGVTYGGGHQHVHSPEEIQILIGQSEAGGLLDAEDRRLLDNAFRVGELTAREVAVPRTNLVAASIDTPVQDVLKVAAESAYTRIPIYEGDIDHIIGFVHIKELFQLHYTGEEANLQSILREAPFVPETMTTNEVWETLDSEKSYLAIVFDEYGGTMGIITREDLIEELFGEVQDEFDHEKAPITRVDERHYKVRGDLQIAHVNDELNIKLPNIHADTVGGLILHTIGRIPKVGDEVEIEGIHVRVDEVGRRSVNEVSIVLPPTTTGEGAN